MIGLELWLLWQHILHRLMVVKVKIDNFFCLNRDIWNLLFTEMFFESSSKFRMAFVQVAEFDWLPG